jgi:hypothetical protein
MLMSEITFVGLGYESDEGSSRGVAKRAAVVAMDAGSAEGGQRCARKGCRDSIYTRSSASSFAHWC